MVIFVIYVTKKGLYLLKVSLNGDHQSDWIEESDGNICVELGEFSLIDFCHQ